MGTANCNNNAVGETYASQGGACRSGGRRSLQQDVLGEIPNNEAMKVYGFVRVPKTGSTCTFNFDFMA
jgi:hypothetical protein